MAFASRFLRYPDLFPARLSGVRWGSKSFVVDLPGGPYAVTSLSEAQHAAMQRRYARWEAKGSAPSAITIEAFSADPADFTGRPGPGDDYLLDLDATPDTLRLAAYHFMSSIVLGTPGRGGIWTWETEGDEFIGAIENVLRPLVAYRVLATGGLLLHSSAVVIENRSFVFVGHSGAGKSTIAGLALDRGHQVLSDDLNHLQRDGDGWTVCAMPFAGDFQGRGLESRIPVAGVFRIGKGDEHVVESMSSAEGFSLLLGSSPFVNTDPHRAARLEETIHDLVTTVPMRRLTFRKDQGLWSIIEDLCTPGAAH